MILPCLDARPACIQDCVYYHCLHGVEGVVQLVNRAGNRARVRTAIRTCGAELKISVAKISCFLLYPIKRHWMPASEALLN
jgi:hypothetical protein